MFIKHRSKNMIISTSYNNEMDKFKIKLSYKLNYGYVPKTGVFYKKHDGNWKHNSKESYPILSIKCDHKSFLADDQKIQAVEFAQNFWEEKDENGLTYGSVYQDQLSKEIYNVISKLENEWEEKFSNTIRSKFIQK